MNPTAALASTNASFTLWRLGNGQKQRLGFYPPSSSGPTDINDEGTAIRLNNYPNQGASGVVQFYSGGVSPALVASIDNTGKATFSGVAIPAAGLNLTKTAAPASPASGSILLYADSSTGNATCLSSAGTNCFAAAALTPTGTGFTHITGGTQDAAARAIDVSTADVTGVLAKSRQAATTMYTDQANTVTSGKLSTVASAASGAEID